MRYSITREFVRPASELLSLFTDLAVADICDVLGRNAALPSALKPLGRDRLLGTAYTVNLPASENLLLYYAVDNAQPGDVLVVSCAGYTERAVTGEIMANVALRRGLAGFVVDGAVRDAAALRQLDFPVYARAVSPNGPYKSACGAVNVPVALGNVVVSPGDIIVGDADGLVAVRPQEAQEAAEKARRLAEDGQGKLAQIAREGRLDYAWLYKKLESGGCVVRDSACGTE